MGCICRASTRHLITSLCAIENTRVALLDEFDGVTIYDFSQKSNSSWALTSIQKIVPNAFSPVFSLIEFVSIQEIVIGDNSGIIHVYPILSPEVGDQISSGCYQRPCMTHSLHEPISRIIKLNNSTSDFLVSTVCGSLVLFTKILDSKEGQILKLVEHELQRLPVGQHLDLGDPNLYPASIGSLYACPETHVCLDLTLKFLELSQDQLSHLLSNSMSLKDPSHVYTYLLAKFANQIRNFVPKLTN